MARRAATGTVALAGALLGVVWAAAATAHAPALVLEHLTTSDGLPQSSVYTTLQDSQGFVWLATEDGLVRFDGRELLRYAHEPARRDSLPGNFIYQIVEDPHHDLWLTVKDSGLARWNRASDTFTIFRHDPKNPGSLASDSVRALLVDGLGRLWVGTDGAGVDLVDPASGSIQHLRHDPADPDSLRDDRVESLSLDRSGNIWVGMLSGLDRWQPAGGGFRHLGGTAGGPGGPGGSDITHVIEDRSGALWVSTFDGGLDRMDRDGRVLAVYHHDPRLPDSLGSDSVHTVLEDQAGHLWVGTSAGLDLFDPATNGFHHYRNDPSDADSLRDSDILSLYQDRTGLVWIGTRAGGVSRWSPRSWELGGQRPSWLKDKFVQAFADAPDGRIWIGSMGGGLVRFDPATGEAADIDALVRRPNALGDRRVMSLHLDRHGTLWIGTMGKGLLRLDADGSLSAIAARPGDPHGVSAPGIMTIFEAHDGRIWLGTFGGGADVLDPATGLIRQLPHDGSPGAVSGPNVSAIAEDEHGNLWLGTDGSGLNLARPDGSVMRVFRRDPDDPHSLPADAVYALALDARKRLWVATDSGGLTRVEGSSTAPGAIHFRAASGEEQLSSHTLYGVLADAGGALWLSGNAGLVRFDPDSGAVKTWHREDGLQGEEFNFGAYARLRDGRLCFGGPGGFNIFDPARLTQNRSPPRPALTRVEILGAPAPGRTPYWLLDHLDLNHRQNIVSLDFSALDFTAPTRNRIAYRIADLTDRWIDLGAENRLTLTNLGAGDHVLEVRAANSDSVWSETPLRLTIHEQPAPWRSRWAYATYVLAALGLLAWALHRHREKFRRVERQRRQLESEVALRTRELLESNQQLALAMQAKTNFMDRMSHELRTPMNGVVGMAELLARTALSPRQGRLTGTIRSSTQLLLQIVNDLLDLSKIRAGKLQLETLPIDLVQVLEESAGLFMAAAESKGIELIVCPPAGGPWPLSGDPLRLRQILMNLIGNALKFTAQGEVAVRADVERLESGTAHVTLSVADTGIGMDDATMARIFEPFTQADESTTRRFGGSGLGLAICRELAQAMGGSITVESRPQAGSRFVVSLPLRVDMLAAATAATAAPAPPATRARILTRRPALAEALARNVAALGLTVVAERDAEAAGDADLLIIDAGTYLDHLRALLEQPGPRPRLLIVATSAQIDGHGLDRIAGAGCTVLKPVHREALSAAVATALGTATVPEGGVARPVAVPAALGGHVLLVEDEPINAEVAQGYLEALGCTWVWVKSGAEAVARSAIENFDLVLMDLSMPAMDGFATTALIRARDTHRRRVPIIALSAHDAATYRDSCVAAGMDDMLSKPCTLSECEQMLRRWIGKPGCPGASTSTSTSTPAARHMIAGDLAGVDEEAVAVLRRLGRGRTDLYPRLVGLFHDSSTAVMEQLRAALAGNDLPAAGALSHRLNSSAANVGALAFSRELRRLEEACAAGDGARAWQMYERLHAAHPGLLAALGTQRLRETA